MTAGPGATSRLPTLGPKGEGWVVIQMVLFALEATAGLLNLGGPIADGGVRIGLAAIGVVGIVGGGLLAVLGVVTLRDSLTALPHPRDGASLIETGVYRLVRHPIYGGIIIGALGFGLATASAAAIAGAGVLLAFFRLKSGLEEAWLGQRYPEYAAYRTRTRRMLPFLY